MKSAVLAAPLSEIFSNIAVVRRQNQHIDVFFFQTWEAAQMKCAIMVSLPALMTSLHAVITGKMIDRTPAAAAVSAHQQQQRLQQLAGSADNEPTDADWDQVTKFDFAVRFLLKKLPRKQRPPRLLRLTSSSGGCSSWRALKLASRQESTGSR